MASGGHTAREAERQAARILAFASADPRHIDVFAAASVGLWSEIAEADASAWTQAMAQAAREWRRHRGGGTP